MDRTQFSLTRSRLETISVWRGGEPDTGPSICNARKKETTSKMKIQGSISEIQGEVCPGARGGSRGEGRARTPPPNRKDKGAETSKLLQVGSCWMLRRRTRCPDREEPETPWPSSCGPLGTPVSRGLRLPICRMSELHEVMQSLENSELGTS